MRSAVVWIPGGICSNRGVLSLSTSGFLKDNMRSKQFGSRTLVTPT